jgi:hypothetical protein
MVAVRINLAPLRRELDRINSFARRGYKDVAAPIIVEDIREHTERGVNYTEEPFKPYAELTKAKRRQKGLPTDKVTLRFTGQMLNSLHLTNDRRAVSVSSAELPKARKVSVDRPFMGVSAKGKQKLRRVLRKAVNARS